MSNIVLGATPYLTQLAVSAIPPYPMYYRVHDNSQWQAWIPISAGSNSKFATLTYPGIVTGSAVVDSLPPLTSAIVINGITVYQLNAASGCSNFPTVQLYDAIAICGAGFSRAELRQLAQHNNHARDIGLRSCGSCSRAELPRSRWVHYERKQYQRQRLVPVGATRGMVRELLSPQLGHYPDACAAIKNRGARP